MKSSEFVIEARTVKDPDNRETYKGERLPSLNAEPYDTVGLDVEPDAIQDFDFNDDKELIAKMLKKLPQNQANSLYQMYFQDMTLADIARANGYSGTRAKAVNDKAHRVLRGLLQNYLSDDDPRKIKFD